MTLLEQILRLANLWTDASGHKSLARLSTIVANDGGLLKRLEDGAGCTLATLDKFSCHLRDFANWPGDTPPDEARQLIDALPHIVTAPAAEEPELPFDQAAAA